MVFSTYMSNGGTEIRQSVQDIFRPVLRSFRRPARKARQGAGPLLFQPTTKPTDRVVLYDLRGVDSPRIVPTYRKPNKCNTVAVEATGSTASASHCPMSRTLLVVLAVILL